MGFVRIRPLPAFDSRGLRVRPGGPATAIDADMIRALTAAFLVVTFSDKPEATAPAPAPEFVRLS